MLYRGLIFFAIAFSLASCGGNSKPSSSPGSTPSRAVTASAGAAVSPVASVVGSPSASCQPSPPQTIAPYFGPAVGATPLWAIGPLGAQPFPVTGPPEVTGPGTRVKVLWVLEPQQEASVTLRGSNLADGTPLWFELAGAPPATEAVFDPRAPGIPVQHGQWREWPSYLYAPVAGCYVLEARWPGGSWRLMFAAAGEVPSPRPATPGTPSVRIP